MTRKRFVKLLMGGGISRNQANKLAWTFFGGYGLPYENPDHLIFFI